MMPLKIACSMDRSKYRMLDEIPYDFSRKRLSVLLSDGTKNVLITKGALEKVLELCVQAEMPDGKVVPVEDVAERIQSLYRELSSKGFRTLGVSYKDVGRKEKLTKDEETAMTFLGVIVLYDPLKPGIGEAVAKLKQHGVTLKIIHRR